jgi:hypothetical protein
MKGLSTLNKFLIACVAYAVVEFIATLQFNAWFDTVIAGGTLNADRITSASNAVIQLDSFLIAGFIVGFFYLWEKIESLTKKTSSGQWVIALSFIPMIGFSISGLSAVGAILTTYPWYLRSACLFLIGGVAGIIFNWYALQLMLRTLKK